MAKAARIALYTLLAIVCVVGVCLLESVRVERIVTMRLAQFDASDAKTIPPHADLSQKFAAPLLLRVMQTNSFEDDFWADYATILAEDPKQRLADFRLYGMPILMQAVTLKPGAPLLYSFDGTDLRDPLILKHLAHFDDALLALGMKDIKGTGDIAASLLLQIAPLLEPARNPHIARAKAEMLGAAAMLIQNGARVDHQFVCKASSDAYNALAGALEIAAYEEIRQRITQKQESLILDMPLAMPFIKLSVYRPLGTIISCCDQAKALLIAASTAATRGNSISLPIDIIEKLLPSGSIAVVQISRLLTITSEKQ